MGHELAGAWYGLRHISARASELIDLASESIQSAGRLTTRSGGESHETGVMSGQPVDVTWTEFRAVVADQFGAHVDCIDREAAFVADLGASSLDMTLILTAFERRYQITIPRKDVSRLVTVGDAFDFVVARTASRTESSPAESVRSRWWASLRPSQRAE
jgi:acyl carrier protein